MTISKKFDFLTTKESPFFLKNMDIALSSLKTTLWKPLERQPASLD
ncbi:hypothetical protein C4K08_3749 [Pseudomonas chlororaphis subsp. aureofaciens]|nr:hypothetical protein C4K08_3749 [Pseudomonas chlororaphis subsp. aureofaciens]